MRRTLLVVHRERKRAGVGTRGLIRAHVQPAPDVKIDHTDSIERMVGTKRLRRAAIGTDTQLVDRHCAYAVTDRYCRRWIDAERDNPKRGSRRNETRA